MASSSKKEAATPQAFDRLPMVGGPFDRKRAWFPPSLAGFQGIVTLPVPTDNTAPFPGTHLYGPETARYQLDSGKWYYVVE